MQETVKHQVRYDRPPPFNGPGARGTMEPVAEAMEPGGHVAGLTQKEKACLVKALAKRRWPCTSKKEGHTFTVWCLEKKQEAK